MMRSVRHAPLAGTAVAALVVLVVVLAALLLAATLADGPTLPEKTRPLLVLPQPRG
jgi:hypothetical protein